MSADKVCSTPSTSTVNSHTKAKAGARGQGQGQGRLISCKPLTALRRPTPSDNIQLSRAGTWTTGIPDASTSEPVSCRNRRI
ncbi:hypothetical protein AGR1B_pAt30036 [Agrobacterium fabacearum S56]|nr:hypothetical protein AGR1B_pAt30036 [Agrobacterium fabacearum S56]